MSLSGSVKRFDPVKGFGFIVGADGKDIFLHIKSCTDGMCPQQGDTVAYDLQPSQNKPGEMQATNCSGGTAQPGGAGGATPVQGTGAFSGMVKRFNPTKGFGFIDQNGEDLFFHLKACVGTMPREGETVQFDMEASKKEPGKQIAVNVTGGSAPIPTDGGKGKGGPYGWDAWGGDSWGGGGGWGGDSWGGKGGGGFGKGKDKGKGGGKKGGKGFGGGGKGWGGDSWGGKGW